MKDYNLMLKNSGRREIYEVDVSEHKVIKK